jgi:hypothetical protein
MCVCVVLYAMMYSCDSSEALAACQQVVIFFCKVTEHMAAEQKNTCGFT